MPATDQKITLPEADLQEFIEAAKEVRDEAVFAVSEVHLGETTNVLYLSTEDRFERALDTLKFALAEARDG